MVPKLAEVDVTPGFYRKGGQTALNEILLDKGRDVPKRDGKYRVLQEGLVPGVQDLPDEIQILGIFLRLFKYLIGVALGRGDARRAGADFIAMDVVADDLRVRLYVHDRQCPLSLCVFVRARRNRHWRVRAPRRWARPRAEAPFGGGKDHLLPHRSSGYRPEAVFSAMAATTTGLSA